MSSVGSCHAWRAAGQAHRDDAGALPCDWGAAPRQRHPPRHPCLPGFCCGRGVGHVCAGGSGGQAGHFSSCLVACASQKCSPPNIPFPAPARSCPWRLHVSLSPPSFPLSSPPSLSCCVTPPSLAVYLCQPLSMSLCLLPPSSLSLSLSLVLPTSLPLCLSLSISLSLSPPPLPRSMPPPPSLSLFDTPPCMVIHGYPTLCPRPSERARCAHARSHTLSHSLKPHWRGRDPRQLKHMCVCVRVWAWMDAHVRMCVGGWRVRGAGACAREYTRGCGLL